MSIDIKKSLGTIRSVKSIMATRSVRSIRSPTTSLQPRKSVASVHSVASKADALRGLKVPVTRLSTKSVARAQNKARKVELLLTNSKCSTRDQLQSSRYESHVLNELAEWCKPRAQFKDDADISLHPTYNIQGDLSCYVRYLDAKDKYDKQFLQEMAHFIANQPNICDQYFLKRILCYKTRWPPLHTKRELNNFVSKFFQLTPRQKARVEYLMKTDLSLGR